MNSNIFEPYNEGRVGIDAGQSRGVAWGDYDNDGDPDLYVTNAGGQWNSFYENLGNGNFKKLSETNNSAPGLIAATGGNSQGVNWVDIDNDNDLDVYISNRSSETNFLFENLDNKRFQQITESALVNDNLSSGMACWGDLDLDGDLDVVTIGYDANNTNHVFRNDLNGTFVEVQSTPINTDPGPGRACSIGDANNDFLPDIVVANARQPNALFINKGNWLFEKDSTEHLTTDIGYSYGASWVDYDNDGHLDFFIANGTYRAEMMNFLYLNDGAGQYKRNLIDFSTIDSDTSAGVAYSDFDNDGDLDLYVANWGANDEQNQFLENITTGKNWIQFSLKGEQSNSYGIGAKLELYSNGLVQRRWLYPVTGYASQNDYRVHFGLGNSSKIDSLVIHWPSGVIDRYQSISVNTFISITEGETN